jgi:hypothetical protein
MAHWLKKNPPSVGYSVGYSGAELAWWAGVKFQNRGDSLQVKGVRKDLKAAGKAQGCRRLL